MYSLAKFLDAFDVRTSYPLLLTLLNVGIGDEEWLAVSTVLESYLLRRAVCGLTTKNYNRVFLAITRTLRRDGVNPEKLKNYLLEQSGESTEWPADDAFTEAWRTSPAYNVLDNRKTVQIFKRFNDTYYGSKMEKITIEGSLTVEHILPREWVEHWPLEDGSRGMNFLELLEAEKDDPRAMQTRRRNAALQTFGNLTILTQKLNSSVSNGPWVTKRAELQRNSLLPINQQLQSQEIWNESAIEARANELLQRVLQLWPRA